MKLDAHTRKRSPYRRTELLVSLVCIISFSTTTSLTINPRPRHALFSTNNRLVASRSRTATNLETKRDNNAEGDDFADFGQEEGEGQDLAREFFQELEYRQGQSSSSASSSDENYIFREGSSNRKDKQKKDENKSTVRSLGIRAANNGKPTARTSSSPPQEDEPSPPAFSLFSLLSFPAPAPRPATSAGLFSGSGHTVYSSGRSLRTEIDILETTMKNNDAKHNNKWETFHIVGVEQSDQEVFQVVAVSFLIVLACVYYVGEGTGGGMMEVIPHWGGDVTSADHVRGLMSNNLISLENGHIFMGEEAAWLVRESSGLAASVVEAVLSVEELVLS